MDLGVVDQSQHGCYVAHTSPAGVVEVPAGWSLGGEPVEEEEAPDLSLDPETGLLSVVNASDHMRSYVISLGQPLMAGPKALTMGSYASPGGAGECTTCIVVLHPHYLLDLGYLLDPAHPRILGSDVQSLAAGMCGVGPCPAIGFPLPSGHYLCSQSTGGRMTHFHPETFHAVDIDCDPGTPLLSAVDGIVVEARDRSRHTGIHVDNLFHWNSIMVRAESFVVEYVHLATDSICVKEGDAVRRGQRIASSGAVGFCPRPHVHVQVTLTADRKAVTVPFCFEGSPPFQPKSGEWVVV